MTTALQVYAIAKVAFVGGCLISTAALLMLLAAVLLCATVHLFVATWLAVNKAFAEYDRLVNEKKGGDSDAA